MYERNNRFTKNLHLRLTPEQFDFVIVESSKIAMSPSEYIRGLIDAVACRVKMGENTNENVQTNKHDQL